ncbi:hypothetical protein BBO99_00007494 [Phytophthora kernoviae]|uniref:Heterogeneous nuclear ribonucleoprotein Q acidic domain-containing protein n=2 Tax=Phytophthora kernoviae TaxID=325452 RepID=A0A3R7KGT2_9STRA|nr:hypothetical protein G195_008321 [Phytophthora kernoviae 00238/432]KAG2519292.1 hypothetical protein JM16_007191 [Phytophthora kernoviae]KAG2520406.1 hypothetical protein JM18_007125 [Phytophthora kernoviae]RLN46633.1 hypothetical protein BBI17_007525 [Phytophthora kernoviae]RLN76510.1 hypothetical protein BBO99_00007494 [Phytophthora kernoviae]
MDAPLNAKQRRKLLRQQQQQETADIKPEPTEPKQQEKVAIKTKEQKETLVNTKEKEKQKQSQETVIPSDGETLNAQQRRILKRQAKRKAEGIEEGEKKRKHSSQQEGERKRSSQQEGERKSIHLTLFVGQLPYKATEDMKFKGTAFIEVKDSKALGAALSRHHTLLKGRRINVEMTASGGGTKSENRRNKLSLLRKKQSNVQVEKTKALIQKHIDGPEYKLQQEDVDDRMIDFLSWFDYETAKNALEEYNRCVSDRVLNRKAFFMGILKRFRQTDGVE